MRKRVFLPLLMLQGAASIYSMGNRVLEHEMCRFTGFCTHYGEYLKKDKYL